MDTCKKYSLLQRASQYLPVLSILLFTLLGLGEFLGLRLIETPVVVFFSFLCFSILSAFVVLLESLLRVSRTNPLYSITFALLFSAITLKGFMPAVARLGRGGADKVWDLDNLLFVSNARSIFVHGDASQNLGIAGEPLSYHTGPSFLLAALNSKLGVDFLDAIYWLEGLFVLALVLMGLQLIELITKDPVSYRLGFLVALNLPWARTIEDIRIFLYYIFTRPSITFDTMFSSILGLFLLACFWAIFVKSKPVLQTFSAVCTAVSLIEVKPQFFPAILLIILIASQFATQKPRYSYYFLIDLSLVSGIFFLLTTVGSSNQIGIEYGFSLNSLTPFFFKKFLLSAVLFFLVVVLLLVFFKSIRHAGEEWKLQFIRDSKTIFVTALLVIGSTLTIAVIELKVQVTRWLSQELQVSMERNDLQLLLPIYFLSLVVCLGVMFRIVQIPPMSLLGVALAAFSVSIYFQFLSIEFPNKTEDYADLSYSKLAVSNLSPSGTVITNDFFFPNLNYSRPYFGYLNTFTNTQFYFSMPNNFQVAKSWANKFENSMLFFGSNYSLSHFKFLARNNIDSIVFTRRCSSPLIDTLPSYFQRVYSDQNFYVYRLYGLDNTKENHKYPEATKYQGQRTLFGESQCQPPVGWLMPSDSSYLLGTR